MEVGDNIIDVGPLGFDIDDLSLIRGLLQQGRKFGGGRVELIDVARPTRLDELSAGRLEPRHVHVTSNNPSGSAKFWLDEVAVAASYGYHARQIRALRDLVQEHREEFARARDEYFRHEA